MVRVVVQFRVEYKSDEQKREQKKKTSTWLVIEPGVGLEELREKEKSMCAADQRRAEKNEVRGREERERV